MTATIDVPALVSRLCSQPREKEWFEFKSSNAQPEKLGQNISAIANSTVIAEKPYGYIIWEIHDDDHRVIGTRFNPDAKKVNKDDLNHWLSHRLKPSVDFRFLKDQVDGKPVVVLVIPAADHLPVRFDNESYIRVGSHTRRLNDFPDKEKLLWRLLDTRIFEKEIAIESIDGSRVLHYLDYKSYFALAKTPVPPNMSGQLLALQSEDLIQQRDDGAWDILNLGCLAFAQSLGDANSLRRKPIRIVRYSGPGRWSPSIEEELTAGYASGFYKIIDCVNRLAPIDERFDGGIRKQEPRFPLAPIRELIANALIHQDLTVRGAGPLVEIFEDRIEVLNPGVPLIDSKFFVTAPPKSRNEALSRLLRRFGICEERGIGWDKIVHQVELHHLPAPRIEVISDSTRITLYGPRPLATMSPADRIEAIYQHACLQYVKGAHVTNSTVRKRFGLDHKNTSKASRFLAEALDARAISPVNPNAGRKFMKYLPYWVQDDRIRNGM